jgi:DNA polymerase-3 subunit epsilon
MVTAAGMWRDATNLALDLEGSGAQDRDQEAILEIAAVRLTGGLPDLATAYTTLVNPGRPIWSRPWISPGLTTATLASAPTLPVVEPDLTARIHHIYLVGHNISADWWLLHRHCPTIGVAGLIYTYPLVKTLPADGTSFDCL